MMPPGAAISAFLVRIALGLVISGLIWLLGWTQGANSAAKDAAKFQSGADRAVSGQIQKNTKTEAAQAAVSEEVSHEVESRLGAVRRHYATAPQRVRQSAASVHPGAVPGDAEAAGGAEADPANDGSASAGGAGLRAESYESLAERCAVTTVIALGWQDWWSGVEGVTR